MGTTKHRSPPVRLGKQVVYCLSWYDCKFPEDEHDETFSSFEELTTRMSKLLHRKDIEDITMTIETVVEYLGSSSNSNNEQGDT